MESLAFTLVVLLVIVYLSSVFVRWLLSPLKHSDMTARVWQLGPTGVEGEPLVLGGHTAGVRHAAFSPDGTRVVTASASHW